MSVAEQRAVMSEPMTWDQICERFPNQHVCLVEVDRDDVFDCTFRTARVVGNGTSVHALEHAQVLGARDDLELHFTGRIRGRSPGTRIVVVDEGSQPVPAPRGPYRSWLQPHRAQRS
jgi:hypothetical protein